MKAVLILSLVFLTGCSTFKVGAFCYVPFGQAGQCSAGTLPPTPATTEEKKL
jgi:hypothetical protein